jgi:carboxyl-terminal processing protease
MKKANSIFLTIVLCIFTLGVGYYFGKSGYQVSIGATPIDFKIENKTPNFEQEADMAIFWQVWQEVNNKHISKPLDPQKLIWGATRGMVAAVEDPYTLYLDPEQNQSNDEILSGEYEGIGAELTLKNEFVTIVSPFDDSPADLSGLKPGDRIIEVNKENIFGQNLFEVVKKIKGAKGTEITLLISRDQEEPFEVTLKRDTINLNTVKSEDKGDGIVYIRINRFGEKTNAEWDSVVRDTIVKNPNTETVVLDLRRNPGGYLGSAVHVASDFIGKGTVVVEEFSNGTTRELEVDHAGNFIDKKLVILIDEGSASASEILAGTLKERANAILVGKKSFGKGTVQEPIDYLDGSGLNVTIAKWLTPSGYWVHENGLEPDYDIEITEEDVDAERDPQLEKALEIARTL